MSDRRAIAYLVAAIVASWLGEGLLWIRIGFGLWRGEPAWALGFLVLVAAFVFAVGALSWEFLARRFPW